jgi:hypothetical protein
MSGPGLTFSDLPTSNALPACFRPLNQYTGGMTIKSKRGGRRPGAGARPSTPYGPLVRISLRVPDVLRAALMSSPQGASATVLAMAVSHGLIPSADSI